MYRYIFLGFAFNSRALPCVLCSPHDDRPTTISRWMVVIALRYHTRVNARAESGGKVNKKSSDNGSQKRKMDY